MPKKISSPSPGKNHQFINRLFRVEIMFDSPENGLQAELHPPGLPRCRSKGRKTELLVNWPIDVD